jgi:hypothetical protein
MAILPAACDDPKEKVPSSKDIRCPRIRVLAGDIASRQALLQLIQLFTMIDTGGKESLPVITIPSR